MELDGDSDQEEQESDEDTEPVESIRVLHEHAVPLQTALKMLFVMVNATTEKTKRELPKDSRDVGLCCAYRQETTHVRHSRRKDH